MVRRGNIAVLACFLCLSTAAQDRTGKIIIYRESHFVERDYKPSVFCDHADLGRIVSGSFIEIIAQEGKYKCVAETENGVPTLLEVIPGSIAYLKVEITSTSLKRHAFLVMSDTDQFGKQENLKQITTTHLVSAWKGSDQSQGTALQKNETQESWNGFAAPERSAKPGEGGVGYPKCVYCPSPHYTNKARRAKVQGIVKMEVTVGADGKATGIVVVNGIEKELDEEAVNAVKSWEFTPALGPDGTPVAVTTTIEISFRMEK